MLTGGLKRFILWDYPRASWQFDVMVGVILVFMFLTPRSWFRDQPRAPQASHVAQLGAGHGGDVFWIEPELLDGVPENQRLTKVAQILKARAGRTRIVTRLEPVIDSEQATKGYLAFARP